MKPTFLAVCILPLLATSMHAGSISFTSFIADDGNPGVGTTYDTIDVPWSEQVLFNQFNLPGQQLDAAKISYSLYIELTQNVRNNATRSTSPPANFSLKNTLDGGLSFGATPLITFDGGSQVNTATVPRNSAKVFDPFVLDQTAFITLTGADLLPFIGTGTFALTSFANALTTPITTPPANFQIYTHSEGNTEVSVEYIYSAIPTTPHSSVPEAGNTFALLGAAFTGLVCVSKKRNQQNAA